MAPPPLRAHTMVGVSFSHNETCCATSEKITSAGQYHDKSDPHCTLILVHLWYLPVLGVPASVWLRDAASQELSATPHAQHRRVMLQAGSYRLHRTRTAGRRRGRRWAAK